MFIKLKSSGEEYKHCQEAAEKWGDVEVIVHRARAGCQFWRGMTTVENAVIDNKDQTENNDECPE